MNCCLTAHLDAPLQLANARNEFQTALTAQTLFL